MFSDPEVCGNGDYAYRVQACNHAATPLCNPTSTSPVRMVTVARADGLASPDQIAGPNGCDGPERTYIIGWAPGTPGATYYEVEEGDDRNGSYPLITTSATSIQLTHESISGTTYNYRVRACNAGGCSPWRGTAYACVQPDGPPREPQTAPRTTWLHTDALGSPVAETDANGQVTRRQRYEPYGAPTDGSYIQGPGYTGHVTDAATGLSYMQQRYYDPGIGRFLSVDPVTANGNTGGNFNRYWYANNNPYKFTDPDGRYVETVLDIAFIASDIASIRSEGLGWTNGLALAADVVGALLPGATGLGAGVKGIAAVGAIIKGGDSAAAKIAGKAQVTRAGGKETTHASTSQRYAKEDAARADTVGVYQNQTVGTITGGKIQSSVRPDVAAVRTDGKVDVTEVLSPRQKAGATAAKYSNALGDRAGNIRCVPQDKC